MSDARRFDQIERVVRDTRTQLDDTAATVLTRLATHTHPPTPGVYPIGEYGLVASSCPLEHCLSTQTAQTTSRLGLYRMWIPSGVPINGVVMYVATAAATAGAGTINRYGVYTDAGVLAGSSADDATLFTTTGVRAKALSVAISSQTTGRYVYAGFAHNYTTAPKHLTTTTLNAAVFSWKIVSGAVSTAANYRIQAVTAVTSTMPPSFTPANALADTPLAWVGVY